MRLVEWIGALHERDFRNVFLASSTSAIGDAVAPIALTFAILGLTHGSASALGIVLAAHMLPFVVFLLLGGVWADRLPRNRLMMVSDIGRFVTQGATAVLLIWGTAHVWELAALQALNGLAGAFFAPAATGLTPQVVSAERLQQANALLSFSEHGTGLIGPAVGAILLATIGGGWALAIDAVTFAASAAFLSRVRLERPAAAEARPSFVSDLAGGWREVRSRAWLWSSIMSFMSFQLVVLSSLFVLGPVVAARSLGGAPAWAAIVTSFAAGGLLGNVAALRFQPRRPLFFSHVLTLAAPVLLALLGVHALLPAIAAAAFVTGAAFAMADVLWFTVLQENVPERALSRVSSYDWLGSTVLNPVGFAIVGPIASAIGIAPALVGAALVTLGTRAVVLSLPAVRSIVRRTSPAPPAAEAMAAEPITPD